MGLARISILGRDGPPSTEPDSTAAPLSWALRELGSLDRHSTMDASSLFVLNQAPGLVAWVA